jgi:hypothetical protein
VKYVQLHTMRRCITKGKNLQYQRTDWSRVASATEEFESVGRDIYNSIKTIVDKIRQEFNISSVQTLIVSCKMFQQFQPLLSLLVG